VIKLGGEEGLSVGEVADGLLNYESLNLFSVRSFKKRNQGNGGL